MDLTVNPDGSGSIDVELIISEAFLAMAAEGLGATDADPNSLEDACQAMAEEDSAEETLLDALSFASTDIQVDLEVVFEDSSCHVRQRLEWSATQSGAIFELMAEDDGPRLQRVGSDGWSFELPLGDRGVEDTEEFELGLPGAFGISVVVEATLPGGPLEHNANSVRSECDATTFKWDIDILNPPDRLFAVADGQGDCGSGWGVGPIVAVVILGVVGAASGAAILISRSRRSRVEPVDPA